MLHFNKLSYWEKNTYIEHIDHIIIGSGLTGLSTAIELKRLHPEAKIIVVERGYLPTGASTKNAGFTCFGSPSELLDDIDNFGIESVKKTIKLRWEGLQKLKNRIGLDNMNYSECGSYDLFTTFDNISLDNCCQHISFLNELIQELTGLKNCYSIVDNPNKLGFKGVIGAIYNQYEGSIETGAMMKRLIQLASSSDIQILNGIEVLDIKSSADSVEVTTNFGTLQAKKVALCTNGLTKRLFPEIDLAPARAQVLVTSPIHGLQLPSTYHYDKGYFYFRTVAENRILIGGGRNYDFKNEETDSIENTVLITTKIKELLEKVIIPSKPYSIDYQWAGIMAIGKEKMPIIASLGPNIFCAVRFGGMGVAMGSQAGYLLAKKMHA